MNTTPLNSSTSGVNGSKRKWTRASIAAAFAAGVITAEAATLLYSQLKPETQTDAQPDPIPEPDSDPVPEPTIDSSYNTALSPESSVTQIPDPTPEPEIAIDNSGDPIQEPTMEAIPEPNPESGDIVDVIVEEIDPQDVDMDDILLVDDIGTVYTVDGRELNAALIHDSQGNQAVMVDVDGDHVYDVIATPEGEVIAEVPGDIDVSDVELLYAQQHEHTGYLEQNDLDVAMNQENSNIQNDMSLT